MCCCCGDAVDENKIILCCALGCCHCGLYNACDCTGCSGKVGICCINCEMCCKTGAPCLFPFGCCGPNCEFDGCAIMKLQCQTCCLAITGAFPCDEEVPHVWTVLGCTIYPKCGCCVPIKNVMSR